MIIIRKEKKNSPLPLLGIEEKWIDMTRMLKKYLKPPIDFTAELSPRGARANEIGH